MLLIRNQVLHPCDSAVLNGSLIVRFLIVPLAFQAGVPEYVLRLPWIGSRSYVRSPDQGSISRYAVEAGSGCERISVHRISVCSLNQNRDEREKEDRGCRLRHVGFADPAILRL